MRMIIMIIFAFGINAILLSDAALAEIKYYFIELSTATFVDMELVASDIQGEGLRIRHLIPPDRLIAKGDESKSASILQLDGVTRLQYGEKSTGVEYSSDPAMVIPYFDDFLQWLDVPTGISPIDFESTFPPPDLGLLSKPSSSAEVNKPMTDEFDMFTGEYMIGRLAVAVMLMESGPAGVHDWTPELETNAIAGILRGADLLKTMAANHGVKISWVWEFHTSVPTPVEPIRENHVPRYQGWEGLLPDFDWEFGWVNDALAYLNIGTDEWDGCYDYANHLRGMYNADWGYEVFVVNTTTGEVFADDSYSFHQSFYKVDLGTLHVIRYQSPVVVLVSWPDRRIDAIFAHETSGGPQCLDSGLGDGSALSC